MTEKRFTLSKDTEWWFVQDNTIQVNEHGYRDDLTGEDKYKGLKQDLTEQEVVDLLNELNDRNNFLSDFRDFITMEHQKAKEENEQLKQTLRIYRKVANCRNCDYHNYDWYDDGDEFEICEKGKNMENGICEDWREL